MTYRHSILQPPCPASEDKEHHYRREPVVNRRNKWQWVCKDCWQGMKEPTNRDNKKAAIKQARP